MAKKPKKPPRPKGPSPLRRWWEGMPDERRRRVRRAAMRTSLVLAGLAILTAGAKGLESAVLRTIPRTDPEIIYVQLRTIPAWMPKTLSRRIAESVAPRGLRFDDPGLTARAHELAVASPWIQTVHHVEKRRARDGLKAFVEVSVDFRRPTAKVQHRDLKGYVYVDGGGVVLPDSISDPRIPRWRVKVRGAESGTDRWSTYTRRDEIPANLRRHAERAFYPIVQGVEPLPPAPGCGWAAPDLADGLRLLELTSKRDYRDQITVVDVRNHGGRLLPTDPHLRLYAQVGKGRVTEVRFGRFPAAPGDFVVPPDRKLSRLDRWVAEHKGRLADTRAWIDLRFDPIHLSID